MENLLFREIVKVVLMFVSPLVILSLLFFDKQPGIAIAFFVGALLGVFRLKALFAHVSCALNQEKSSKDIVALIKYLVYLFFTLGLIGFALVKSVTIGLAILFGLISVPIMVTVYAMLKGISLYTRK